MKNRNKLKVLFCFFAIVLIIIIIFALLTLTSERMFFEEDAKESREKIAQLLYKTDHSALLEACRTVLERVDAGQLDMDDLSEIRESQNLETLNLPEEIVKLDPTYITIFASGVVMLELHGGYHHSGVFAFPEDFDYIARPSYTNEGMMLIKDLWYYDDGFHDVDNYEIELEALRQGAIVDDGS